MKQQTKKWLALVLCLLMVAVALTACEQVGTNDPGENEEESELPPETEEPFIEEPEAPAPGILEPETPEPTPPVKDPPAQKPPVKDPPAQKPPSEDPPEKDPPADTPPVGEGYIGDLSYNAATRFDDGGREMVKNTDSILLLVNKIRNLPSTYVPKDLVKPNIRFSFSEDVPKRYLRQPAARALERLFKAASDAGHKLYGVSGYRSYSTQKSIFERNAAQKGEEEANRTSARPGQSEHQTGLAMDISSAAVDYRLSTSFGSTAEGKWVRENAHKYGFIIRYPKGTEDITGYSYEPWHLRYVGTEAARYIYKNGLTLEQYFQRVYDYP